MDNSLSQAEIDALLKGIPTTDIDDSSKIDNDSKSNNDTELNNDSKSDNNSELTLEEIDALGEIGNISFGTSATTLFALLGQRIVIDTPNVTLTTWENLSKEHTVPYVAIRVRYTDGLEGANLLILKENDVKIITDLMMGGKGVATEGELTEMHLSAISEAMNQMIGSSATSLSSLLNKRIDISPPTAFIIKFDSLNPYDDFNDNDKLVKIAFKMEVGDLIDSQIMQLLPLSFAKSLLNNLFNNQYAINEDSVNEDPTKQDPIKEDIAKIQNPSSYEINSKTNNIKTSKKESSNDFKYQEEKSVPQTINVQPAHFKSFEEETVSDEKHNIDIVMDIPLQVTVELGRTQKLIKDILEFNYGTIIELDKLAGDPVDIFVNGKIVAKGEVVVIDDNFAVRITDIVHPSKRL